LAIFKRYFSRLFDVFLQTKGVIMVKVRKNFCGKHLIDNGLFAEENFADWGKKRKNRKTFFRKHFVPLK